MRSAIMMLVAESLSCRLLDDVETGGGDTQGHGMVLALHMMKLLKSYRKFLELLTKKYHPICHWLHCLQPLHMQFSFNVSFIMCTCTTKGRAAFVCTYVINHHCTCCLTRLFVGETA